MTEEELISRSTEPTEEHPSVLAWRQVHGNGWIPTSVEVLQQEKKSEIYRLLKTTPAGDAIIAKRCLSETGNLEKLIYEDILPGLPISQLHYYGTLQKTDSEVWLFLEDAGQQPFSSENEAHRQLAIRWLSELHRSGQRSRTAQTLPLRDPPYYYTLLQMGLENIRQNLENPALTPEYLDILHHLLAQLETLESDWEKLAAYCEPFPRTLVHSDFQPKNVRVRPGASGEVLYALDWELAGWGAPVLDLISWCGCHVFSTPELHLYRDLAQEFWPHLDLPTLQFAINVGCIFRRLAAIYWSSLELPYEWVDKPVLSMEIYQEELTHALTAVFGRHA